MEEVNFEEKNQKILKGLSKAIYIISKIIKIAIRIAIGALVFAMIVVPIVFSHIEIKDNEIEVYGHTIGYEIKDNIISLTDEDGKIEKIDLSDHNIINLDNIKFDKSMSEYIVMFETIMVCAVIVLIFVNLAFRNVEKLFKNINKEDTPFTLENIKYINKIAIYYGVLIVLPTIIGIIIKEVTKIKYTLGMGINLASVVILLVIINMSYIFRYGYQLQLKTKKESNE